MKNRNKNNDKKEEKKIKIKTNREKGTKGNKNLKIKR
jgi:hypothetical protein